MKLYVVRHGQTDWNLKRLAQGRADVPLNQTGIEQAQKIHEDLRGVNFNVCYSSPLIRAVKTAEIIVGGRCEIVLDELLIERAFGDYEGTSPGEEWIYKYWSMNENDDLRGMEPMPSVFERTKKFLDKIKKRHSDKDTILIVGHGGMLKSLHFNIVGYDETTDLMSVHFKNGEIWEYEI